MALASIISLILFVIIAVLVFRFIKNTVKSILLLLAILFFVSVAGGILIYADANDFRQNFPAIPSLYLLEKDGRVVAGFYGAFSETSQPFLTKKDRLSEYQAYYEEEELDKIKGDYYKIFIFKSESFDYITEVQTEGEVLSRETIFDLLSSDTPVNDYLILKEMPLDQRSNLLNQLKLEDKSQFKALLFVLLFSKSLDEKGPLFTFTEFKQGNVVIYPESAITSLIKEIPLSLLDNLILKVSGGE